MREHAPYPVEGVTQQRRPVRRPGDRVLAQAEPRQRSRDDQGSAADEEGTAWRHGDEKQAAKRVTPDLGHLRGDPDQGAGGHIRGFRHG